MIWCSIIVYTVDRRWVRAAAFCVLAAFFASIGIIHQDGATTSKEVFMDGTISKGTSAFEYMMGYLSMAVLCLIYSALQKYFGKKVSKGEEGYEDDHGYLPPIEESGVDDMFSTWWDPVGGLEPSESAPVNNAKTKELSSEEASSDDVEAAESTKKVLSDGDGDGDGEVVSMYAK